MEQNRTDSVAIVTGAAGGIGYSVALALCAAGYSVAIIDLDGAAAQSAAESAAKATGAKTCWSAADVTNEKACEAAYAHVCASLGVPSILVNNAGMN